MNRFDLQNYIFEIIRYTIEIYNLYKNFGLLII